MDRVAEFGRFMLQELHEPTFEEVVSALKLVSTEQLVVSSRMHRHVLGFTQLRISSLEGRELRMHYWPEGGNFSEEPHTHLWDLKSYVLWGHMVSRSYRVASAEDSKKMLYTVRAATDGTVREPTSNYVDATISVEASFERGESYVVPQGAFHTSEPLEGDVLTLIVTSRALVDRPSVVTEPEAPRTGHAPMTPVTADDISRFQSILKTALA